MKKKKNKVSYFPFFSLRHIPPHFIHFHLIVDSAEKSVSFFGSSDVVEADIDAAESMVERQRPYTNTRVANRAKRTSPDK